MKFVAALSVLSALTLAAPAPVDGSYKPYEYKSYDIYKSYDGYKSYDKRSIVRKPYDYKAYDG
jgi:hypothetical protein